MKTFKSLIPIFISCLFSISLWSQTEVVQILNDSNQLTFTPTGNFTQVNFQSDYTVVKNLKPGHPELPVIQYNIIIPENVSIQSIELLNSSEQEIQGNYNVYPAQKLLTTDEQAALTITMPLVHKGIPGQSVFS